MTGDTTGKESLSRHRGERKETLKESPYLPNIAAAALSAVDEREGNEGRKEEGLSRAHQRW